MPSARDLLERFRPAGAPGAAGPAGVPVDRVGELTRELAPVFEALDPVQEECRRIRAAAADDARIRRATATWEASRIVAAGHVDAEAARAGAAEQLRGAAGRETAATLAEAEREAARIRLRVAERIGQYLDRVVAEVLRSPDGAGRVGGAG